MKLLARQRPAYALGSNVTGYRSRGNRSPRDELAMRFHPSRHSSVMWYRWGVLDGAKADSVKRFRLSPHWRTAKDLQYRSPEWGKDIGVTCYRAGFWEGAS